MLCRSVTMRFSNITKQAFELCFYMSSVRMKVAGDFFCEALWRPEGLTQVCGHDLLSKDLSL
jgi:hypothetical protein